MYTHAQNTQIKGIDWTVALDREQFFQGGCGMCIELHGTGKGSGGDPVKGVYHVFVNNLCPEVRRRMCVCSECVCVCAHAST